MDKENLKELMARAIGKRKQKDFAELIGIRTETLSRIMNGKYNSPMQKETLMQIALNSEGAVTYKELLVASGYAKDSISSDRPWTERAVESFNCFYDDYFKKPVSINPDDISNVYKTVYSDTDVAMTVELLPATENAGKYADTDDYICPLKFTWMNKEDNLCLSIYAILSGYKRAKSGTFCKIHSTKSYKDATENYGFVLPGNGAFAAEMPDSFNELAEDLCLTTALMDIESGDISFISSGGMPAAKELRRFTDYFAQKNDIALMSEDEYLVYEGLNNTIYSKNLRASGIDSVKNGMLVIGNAGSGKSRAAIRPNILQCNSSYVCTIEAHEDIDYFDVLEKRGYNIVRLDTGSLVSGNMAQPAGSYKTCLYNPFKYIDNYEQLCGILVSICEQTNVSGDPFFVKTLDDMVSCMVESVFFVVPKHQRCLAAAYSLLSVADNIGTLADMLRNGKCFEEVVFDTKSGRCEFKGETDGDYSRSDEDVKNVIKKIERLSVVPKKTFAQIALEAATVLSPYRFMFTEDTLHLDTIGDYPSALFIDVDLANPDSAAIADMVMNQSVTFQITKCKNIADGDVKYLACRCGNAITLKKEVPEPTEENMNRAEADLRREMDEYKDAVIEYDEGRYVIKSAGGKILQGGDGRFAAKVQAEMFIKRVLHGQIRELDGTNVSHVRYIFDEMINRKDILALGHLSQIMKNYNMSVIVAVQSLEQLHKIYGPMACIIARQFDILYLGSASYADISELSASLTNRGISLHHWNPEVPFDEKADTADYMELLYTLKSDECLVIPRFWNEAYIDRKYFVDEHPLYCK